MENNNNSPVQIVQELLAILAMRKEMVQKISDATAGRQVPARLTAIDHQTETFINELMQELSAFGDAVSSEVDRQNDYQNVWKKFSARLEEMPAAERERSVEQMEVAFRKEYTTIGDNTGLPDTLKEVISRQKKLLAR